MNLGDIFNWKTILIFILAFIAGSVLRYFISKNRNSTERVRKKKAKQRQNRPQKVNLGAVKGTQPKKKKKK